MTQHDTNATEPTSGFDPLSTTAKIRVQALVRGTDYKGDIEPEFAIGNVEPEGAKVPMVASKCSRALRAEGIEPENFRQQLEELNDDKDLRQPEIQVGTVVIDSNTYEVIGVNSE